MANYLCHSLLFLIFRLISQIHSTIIAHSDSYTITSTVRISKELNIQGQFINDNMQQKIAAVHETNRMTILEEYLHESSHWKDRSDQMQGLSALTPRIAPISFSFKGRHFMIGGANAGDPLTHVMEYDPVQRSISLTKSTPSPVTPSLCVLNDFVVAFGGDTSLMPAGQYVFVFDIDTLDWLIPTVTGSGEHVSDGLEACDAAMNRMYIVGGKNVLNSDPTSDVRYVDLTLEENEIKANLMTFADDIENDMPMPGTFGVFFDNDYSVNPSRNKFLIFVGVAAADVASPSAYKMIAYNLHDSTWHVLSGVVPFLKFFRHVQLGRLSYLFGGTPANQHSTLNPTNYRCEYFPGASGNDPPTFKCAALSSESSTEYVPRMLPGVLVVPSLLEGYREFHLGYDLVDSQFTKDWYTALLPVGSQI